MESESRTKPIGDKKNTIDLSGPVKSYTLMQLANAFIKIHKHPGVERTLVPRDIVLLRQDIKNVIKWKIHSKYSNVPKIGDLNDIIPKILLYSVKPQQKNKSLHQNSKTNVSSTNIVITELEKQLRILLEKNDTSEKHKNDVLIKKTMIDKLKTTKNDSDIKKDDFSPIKMSSIAMRVYDMMIDDQKVEIMYKTLKFLSEPKFDYKKESTGGDYVLPRAGRDRRYKNDSNWKGMSVNTNNGETGSSNSSLVNNQHRISSKKYVAPSMRESEFDDFDQESTHGTKDNPAKKTYIPPYMRMSQSQTNSDKNQTDSDKNQNDKPQNRYISPHERKIASQKCNDRNDGNKSHEPKASFESIDNIQREVNLSSFEDFPELGKPNKPSSRTETNNDTDNNKPQKISSSTFLQKISENDLSDDDVIDVWETKDKSELELNDCEKEQSFIGPNGVSMKSFLQIAREAKNIPVTVRQVNKKITTSSVWEKIMDASDDIINNNFDGSEPTMSVFTTTSSTNSNISNTNSNTSNTNSKQISALKPVTALKSLPVLKSTLTNKTSTTKSSALKQTATNPSGSKLISLEAARIIKRSSNEFDYDEWAKDGDALYYNDHNNEDITSDNDSNDNYDDYDNNYNYNDDYGGDDIDI